MFCVGLKILQNNSINIKIQNERTKFVKREISVQYCNNDNNKAPFITPSHVIEHSRLELLKLSLRYLKRNNDSCSIFA